jgi:hypothetical protein
VDSHGDGWLSEERNMWEDVKKRRRRATLTSALDDGTLLEKNEEK